MHKPAITRKSSSEHGTLSQLVSVVYVYALRGGHMFHSVVRKDFEGYKTYIKVILAALNAHFLDFWPHLTTELAAISATEVSQ